MISATPTDSRDSWFSVLNHQFSILNQISIFVIWMATAPAHNLVALSQLFFAHFQMDGVWIGGRNKVGPSKIIATWIGVGGQQGPAV